MFTSLLLTVVVVVLWLQHIDAVRYRRESLKILQQIAQQRESASLLLKSGEGMAMLRARLEKRRQEAENASR